MHDAQGKQGGGTSRRGVGRRAGVVLVFVLGASGCLSGDDLAEAVGQRGSALTIGPERDVDAPDLLPAAGDQAVAMLVRSGDGYLALWTDDREWFGLKSNRVNHPPELPQVYAARVAADGTVLDPLGIPVTQHLEEFFIQDAVCSDDGFCLLIGNLGLVDSVLSAVRIADGQVLDPHPFPLAGISGFRASIAWDGAEFRLVWDGRGSGVLSASIDRDGRVGDLVPVTEPGDPGPFYDSRIACEGARCLIVHRRDIELKIVGRVMDRSGPASPEFLITAEFQSTFPGVPRPVWDGARYWITYPVHPPEETHLAVQAARISSDGVLLDPSGIEVARDAGNAVINHDGTTAVVLFFALVGDRLVRHGARVTDDGVVLEPGGVPLFPASSGEHVWAGMTLACQVGECLAFWERRLGVERNLAGGRLQGLTELDPGGIDITRSPAAEALPSAVFSAGRYLAVWRDSRVFTQEPTTTALRGAFFSPGMDTSIPVEVGRASDLGACVTKTALAASTSSFLVTWAEECSFQHGNIHAQVLDADGRDLGSTFAVDATSRPELRPSVASAGDQYLVVYDRLTRRWSVEARRYSASGAPLDAARFTIAYDASFPAVAFDGTNYLVVYQVPRSVTVQRKDLAITHVSPAGVILDPPQTRIVELNARDEAHSVACGGGMCLVAWRSGTTEIRALRLSLDGTVVDPDGFVVGPADGLLPATSVAFDGEDFVVGWRMMNGDVRAALVSRDGVVQPPGAFVVTPGAGPPKGLSVVSDGAGHRVVLYDRMDLSPAYRIRRVRARAIEGAPGSVATPAVAPGP
jgi:hypothetical protein